MTHDRRRTKTTTTAGRAKPAGKPDGEREARRSHERRIGAAQLAAPSARTWRRAGRFASPDSA